jgi:hypothetical protein
MRSRGREKAIWLPPWQRDERPCRWYSDISSAMVKVSDGCVHTNRVTLSYSCRSARVGSTLAAR